MTSCWSLKASKVRRALKFDWNCISGRYSDSKRDRGKKFLQNSHTPALQEHERESICSMNTSLGAYNLNIVYHLNSFRELNTNIKSCDSLGQMIIERKKTIWIWIKFIKIVFDFGCTPIQI